MLAAGKASRASEDRAASLGHLEVDTAHQAMVLYFLSLTEETKASRVRLARLSPQAAQMLRHIRDFLGVVFQIREVRMALKAFGEGRSRALASVFKGCKSICTYMN